MGRGHQYTAQQIAWLTVRAHLERNYLTQCFNLRFGTDLSSSAIKGTCKRLGLKTGRTGCFEQGHQSWNAGQKGLKMGGRSAETQFKKGNKPHTWLPIGAERLTKEGYLQRKIADTGNTVEDFVGVHRLLWEEHYGPIPEGHVVVFKDGDRTHIALNNLELITRAELAMRNKIGFGEYPDELKPALGAVVKIRAVIAKRKGEIA